MGGGCNCHSIIKNYFLGSSDCILRPEKNINPNQTINQKINFENNIKIITKEDDKNENNNKSNIIDNSDKTKIHFNNKMNISNISNIKPNNSYLSNDDNKRKQTKKNNSSIFLGSQNSNKIANQFNKSNDNNININKNEDSQCNNNSKRKLIEKKIKEKEKDKLKKADTNYNYNMGENNFIFINISQASSMIKNESEKLEPTTPKIAIEKETLENIENRKRIFSHFCKNSAKDKIVKIQSNNNNKIVKEETNIIFYMNKYSEEMLNFINSIRKNPETFLKYIDNAIDNNIQKLNDEFYIISKNLDEKVKLMEDYLIVFERIKRILKEIINSKKSEQLEELKYNEELEIILDETQNHKNLKNDKTLKKKYNHNIFLDLSDDKIANMILEKRKEIKDKYPDNIFKFNIIRDIEINILIQVSMELFYNHHSDETMLKDIIFNPKYKNFAVSWANEINRNFISISCFA